MLSLHLLGPPIIEWNQQPIGRFRSAKSLALLAYLSIEGGKQSRSTLLTLLWPDLPEDKARQNLSQTITRLRDTLAAAGHVVQANRQSVWLTDSAKITLDVDAFRRLLAEVEQHRHDLKTTCPTCQEKLAQAVALVRGELLARLEISDSPLFEEWLLLERERVHQLLLGALEDLAEGALAGGRYEAAIQYAGRQVALESWRELAHRQLMQALALSGQQEAALAQYEQCRQILEKELGVEPTRVTQELAADIRAGQVQRGLSRPAARLNSNLPVSLTPFIGRQAELAALMERLTADDGVRLITITGPGGIGKTRLAQEVGYHLLTRPPAALAWEGIWFISLIGISTADNVPVAIANTLGLTLPSEEKAATAVIRELRQRRLLLILDNFELLLDSRPWLLELLQAAADLRLIVTSREQLRLQLEYRFALPGLSVPPDTIPHSQALDYEASRLFLDRARRLFKGFRLTADNWPHIVHICRLTEGLPLGIELAATLLEEMTPAELVTRIAADAAVLAADYLDIAPHQRSIYLVFEQSWARLSPAEQRVLSRLAIFESDGFSQAAALHVAGAQSHILRALVRKSLVHARASDLYGLHPLYKAFAGRKLPADHTDLHRAHAVYFTNFLAEAVPFIFDKSKYLKLRSLLPLLPDLRACWNRIIEAADVELIDALAGPLYRLLRETAQLQEGRALFENAWQQLQSRWPAAARNLPQQTVLAHLSSYLGFFHLFCGDIYAARPYLEYALAEFDRLQMIEAKRLPRTALADVLDRLGEYEARLQLRQQALQEAEAGNNQHYLNDALGNLGEALHHMGRLSEARDIYLRTIETATADVPDANTAITMNNLGLAELALGNLAEARHWLEQSLHIRQQYGNTHRVGAALRALGLLAIAEGDYPTARQQLEAALEQYTQSGRVDGLGPVYLALAELALKEGELGTAEVQIRRALASAVQLQQTPAGLNGLWYWGQFLWAAGRRDEALVLLGYLLGHPNTSGYLAWEINRFLSSEGVVLEAAGPVEEMGWQAWLESKLFQ